MLSKVQSLMFGCKQHRLATTHVHKVVQPNMPLFLHVQICCSRQQSVLQ